MGLLPEVPKGTPADANAEICEATPGATISECIKEAVDIAKQRGGPVAFEFNGATVVAQPYSDPDQKFRQWWQDVYHETPDASAAKR
jgi:sugar/nucleoside kinase (ribokinase family)